MNTQPVTFPWPWLSSWTTTLADDDKGILHKKMTVDFQPGSSGNPVCSDNHYPFLSISWFRCTAVIKQLVRHIGGMGQQGWWHRNEQIARDDTMWWCNIVSWPHRYELAPVQFVIVVILGIKIAGLFVVVKSMHSLFNLTINNKECISKMIWTPLWMSQYQLINFLTVKFVPFFYF